jgi:hypothetical protein
MVEQIKDIKDWDRIFPNVTMEAKWDNLAEIRTTLKELTLPCRRDFEHIESHQDKHKPRESLSLKARLNCIADDLAEEYHQKYPRVHDHTRVPLLPTSGCQLNLAHGTTTRDIKRELKLARVVLLMKAKLKQDNFWDEEEYNSIDWQSHKTALN